MQVAITAADLIYIVYALLICSCQLFVFKPQSRLFTMAPKRRTLPLLTARPVDSWSVEERVAYFNAARSEAAATDVRVAPAVRAAIPLLPAEPPAAATVRVTRPAKTSSSTLRQDQLALKNARRGHLVKALTALREQSIDALIGRLVYDRDANSNRGSRKSRVETWKLLHEAVYGAPGSLGFLPLLPLTPGALTAVAALYKEADYRSYPNYISDVRAEHIEQGHAWTHLLEHTSKWCTRSVQRGIGQARQSQAMKLHRVLELSDQMAPACTGGSRFPVRALLIGLMFLLREIEMALSKT